MSKKLDSAFEAFYKAKAKWEIVFEDFIELKNKIRTLKTVMAIIDDDAAIRVLGKCIDEFKSKLKAMTKEEHKLNCDRIIKSTRLTQVKVETKYYSCPLIVAGYASSYKHDFWCSECKFIKRLKCNNPDSEFFKKSVKSLVLVNPRPECYTHPND